MLGIECNLLALNSSSRGNQNNAPIGAAGGYMLNISIQANALQCPHITYYGVIDQPDIFGISKPVLLNSSNRNPDHVIGLGLYCLQ